jgi:hypothetical protein
MSRVMDNLMAYRILHMIVTPFDETDAFKLGIIDKEGNALVDTSALKGGEKRDAYTYLHRLVFNIKKIINRLPGGESKIKNIVSALFLFKECYESDTQNITEALIENCERRDKGIAEKWVRQFLTIEELINVTGAAVSTDIPVPLSTQRRKKPLKLAI